MINSVRNTVLSVIDKDNSGFISPSEFNLFAKAAQLEIYQEYFDQHRKAVLDKNARKGGRGVFDEIKDIAHKTDIFVKEASLADSDTDDRFVLPSDLYFLDYIHVDNKIVEEVTRTEFTYLNMANLATPSDEYKVYYRVGNDIQISPVQESASVVYYRVPADPKWTYLTSAAGDPIFNASASDYQDFELHPEEETQLIVKILRYAGVTIRAEDVVSVAENEDTKEYQKENLT